MRLVIKQRGHVWPSEAVEALAKAIYQGDPIYKPPYWEDCTPDMKVWYRSTARKGLSALAALKGSAKPADTATIDKKGSNVAQTNHD